MSRIKLIAIVAIVAIVIIGIQRTRQPSASESDGGDD